MSGVLTATTPSVGTAYTPQQWGIYDQSGNPIIAVDDASMVEVDAVAAVEYSRDYRISTYPQEQGAFESYNKVQSPYNAVVTFFTSLTRYDFLANIESAVASLDLYTIATPEWSYPSANLVHYSYQRDVRNGVTLLRVEVWAEEVRVSQISPGSSPGASGQINQGSTASTNAASPQYTGTVQATALPAGT